MKPSLWLRIASSITLLFAVGHTPGARESWSPAGETEALRAMKSFRFDAEGVSRTYVRGPAVPEDFIRNFESP